MASKTLHLKLDGIRSEKVELPGGVTEHEFVSLLAALTGISPHHQESVVFQLFKTDGKTHLPVSPAVPENSPDTPYIVRSKLAPNGNIPPFLSADSSNRTLAGKFPGGIPQPLAGSWHYQHKEPSIEHSRSSINEETLAHGGEDAAAFSALTKVAKDLRSTQEKLARLENLLVHHLPSNHYRVTTPINAVKRLTTIDPRFESQPRYTFSEETRKWLKQPTFNTWEFQENEMAALVEHMFFDLGLVEEFHIQLPVLKRFIATVKDNYNQNPFHNFRHSFCVTQMAYGFIHVLELLDRLTMLDKMIIMVAALCHDLDHPGFNNAYQVNARTELAIIYNDVSPLENHHCAVAFTILSNAETNILANVSREDYLYIRKGVINCILNTDLAKHGEILKKHKDFHPMDLSNPAHKELLLILLVKCADISNEVRPSQVADQWLDCLLEEFFAQSDREKAEGLPVAPFMDRDKVTKPQAQVGFMSFVLVPLFEALGTWFPQVEECLLPQIRQSLAHYQALADEEKRRKEKLEKTAAGNGGQAVKS